MYLAGVFTYWHRLNYCMGTVAPFQVFRNGHMTHGSNAGPLVQKLVTISNWQQQSLQPSMGYSEKALIWLKRWHINLDVKLSLSTCMTHTTCHIHHHRKDTMIIWQKGNCSMKSSPAPLLWWHLTLLLPGDCYSTLMLDLLHSSAGLVCSQYLIIQKILDTECVSKTYSWF